MKIAIKLAASFLLMTSVCPSQTAPKPFSAAVLHRVHLIFLDSIKTGNADLDSKVRTAARSTIERFDSHVTDTRNTADATLDISVRQLRQADAQSTGKFVEVVVLDTKTRKQLFLTDQDAGRASDRDLINMTAKAVSEFFNPTMPPPPPPQPPPSYHAK